MKILKHLLTLVLLLSSYTLVAQNTLEDDKLYMVVEDAPMFPGCESLEKSERKACADKKLFKYLNDNIQQEYFSNTGRVIVQFIVEKNGSITNVHVVRGIGIVEDQHAIELIKNMPNWIPGRQRGRPVRVQFTLPVAFHAYDREERYNQNREAPLFPGCDQKEGDDLKKCSKSKLAKYIRRNLEYPEEAQLYGIKGTVIVAFKISSDGSISDTAIKNNGLGYGCNEAALDLVLSMPNWIPAKQDGKPISVYYELQVEFN